MDFESPDVEKDFPGLYASETGRKSNESDFSDDHDKPSKKDLLGRRKDKKEKKDRGYAALEGDSSPEEDTDTKSPSKNKKTKSFKFPTKSKEKREKSRDKEKVLDDATKLKELTEKEKKKEKEREKEREREKKEKEKREKLREKDKEKEEKAKFKLESKEKLKDEKKEKVKDKDKEKVKEKEKDKVKEKEKDKKEKKLTKMPSTVTAGVPFEEIFTLGVALPIFGVPLSQSVERSRCHDDTALPLVVRDSIDYLQAHGLKSNQIYRAEPDKIKLQQLRKLYTDREPTFPYHWDVPVACAILKAFISELPESILTQELHGQFEQAAAIAEPQREAAVRALAGRLPPRGRSLLAWLVRHFASVVAHEQSNGASIQTIATAMGPALNMSLNLITYLITKAEKLFPGVTLEKYVPPLLTIPADFPNTAAELSAELRKQESLLNQIHAEMHAGFITAARDQQLWEAQRIVTQLKRKLRSVQKSIEPNSLQQQQPSIDDKADDEPRTSQSNEQEIDQTTPSNAEAFPAFSEVKESPSTDPVFPVEFEDNFYLKFEKEKDSTFKKETSFNAFKNETKDGFDAAFTAERKDSFDAAFKTERKDTFNAAFKPETKDDFDAAFKPETKDDFDAAFKPETKNGFDSAFKPEIKDGFDAAFKPETRDGFDSAFKPEIKDSFNAAFNPETKDGFDAAFKPETKDGFDSAFKPETKDGFEAAFKPDTKDGFDAAFKPETKDGFDAAFKPETKDGFDAAFKPEIKESFDTTFKTDTKDNFDAPLKKEAKEPFEQVTPTSEPAPEKPKFTDEELKVLRLELENAEYLQLKSLLQAKINSEQFEIVKLRSHVALKNKQEGNLQNNKENKENYTPEEQELRQRLIKENAMLEQKRLSLINQIFQERVACIQLKIELAMKEILSKS